MATFNLPSGVVTTLRFNAERTLSDTCVIYARTRSADGYGDATITETSRGTFACRIAPATPSEQRNNITTLQMTHIITLPFGTTVASTDRITSGTHSFDVTGDTTAKTGALLTTVYCVEVL